MQVKNKLCLAVWGLDGALGGRVGLGDGVGLYQADDASQGLFLILQAMRESVEVGCGTALFGGVVFVEHEVSFVKCATQDRMETIGPNVGPGAVCIAKTPFCNEQLWIRLSYLGDICVVCYIRVSHSLLTEKLIEMPKQKGPGYYTGTRGDACFYKMDGQYYVRRKSTLSGKRVKRDKAFTLTRVYADLLGQASRLAAAVYRCLPREERKHAQYRTMTGEALRMLKEGVAADVISARLEQVYVVKKESVLAAGIAGDLPIAGITPAGIVKEEIVAPSVKVLKTDRSKTAVARLKGKRLFMRLPKQVDIYTMPDGRMEIRLTKKTYAKRNKAVIFME